MLKRVHTDADAPGVQSRAFTIHRPLLDDLTCIYKVVVRTAIAVEMKVGSHNQV